MKKFITKLLVALVLLGALALFILSKATYSEGERSGNILNLSHKGVLIKTWEGKLDLGIFQGARPKTGEVENTVWSFSVASDEVAKRIQEANKRGNRVVLHYEQKFVKLFWLGKTTYIVTDVEEIPNSQPLPGGAQSMPNNMGVPAENL